MHYASDIHLEFSPPIEAFENFTGGEVLILAGDVTNGKHQGLEVLEVLCSRYNSVIMVMGNHEHYKGRFPETYTKLKEVLPNNVYLLENEIVELNGKRFLGCTLWSYMNELDQYFAKNRMNDYQLVRSGPTAEPWKWKLKPAETVATHLESARWLEQNMQEGDIVVTHHAPSSCNPAYVGNTAYATDLSDMILEHKPEKWIHGHLHTKVNYKIGNTTITSNPMGYWGHQIFEPMEVLVC